MTVATDWLNYNTGWWRGLNPQGSHKKWGYILWDLDATFDYYINYTGIPNRNSNASLCDIFSISNTIDSFFNQTYGDFCSIYGGINSPYETRDSIFQLVVSKFPECCVNWDSTCQSRYDNPESLVDSIDISQCPVLIEESSPYPPTDSILLEVIKMDDFCCTFWDATCQNLYNILSGRGDSSNIVDCPVLMDSSLMISSSDPRIFYFIGIESFLL